MQREIIIKKSKLKLVLAGILFLLFLIIAIYHRLDSPKIVHIDYAISTIVGIIFCTTAILVSIYALLFRRHIPVLIITKEGFIYMGKYFVWWGQVKEIETLNVHQLYGIQRFIEIELENLKMIPVDYTKENSKVVSYTQHSKKKSKYITMGFGVFNSTHKTKKVIELMRQYKSEYDRLHQIDNEPKSPKKIVDEK